MVILPSVTSARRGRRLTIVDLPEPVLPMIARVSPFLTVKLMSSIASVSPP